MLESLLENHTIFFSIKTRLLANLPLLAVVTQRFHSNRNVCVSFFTVPPQKPLIVDDRGRTVEGEVGIGPFREGESLSLECNVPGGKLNVHSAICSTAATNPLQMHTY